MALTVRDIRAWLDTFSDDTLIGISEEDEMALRPADDRYDESYLEIGMALSSEYLDRDKPPFVIPPPEVMAAQREAAIEDFLRAYPAVQKEMADTLRASLEAADLRASLNSTDTQAWKCDECGAILPVGDHQPHCSRF